jgi:secreted Zn-dependent insulinase-like peptidase
LLTRVVPRDWRFYEHMLLLGTRRFLAEGGFNDHLARQGGETNA